MEKTAGVFESRLIPILREGVEVVKMMVFKKLKEQLQRQYPEAEAAYALKLTGAVVNELFGTTPDEKSFVIFLEQNRETVEQILLTLSERLAEMRIPLTDALRISVLCDSQEGIDTSSILMRARDLGILLTEREAPLPHHFMELVRRLGRVFNLIVPPAAVKDEALLQ